MIPVFVGLGSNVGPRERHLEAAVHALSAMPDTRLDRVSSIYETEPVGDPRQPAFLNAVARIASGLSPESTLEELRRIESDHGRRATGRGGARTIDLDLLYHGERVIRRPGLSVPHPWIADRLFVLIPMVEIAPEWVDPLLCVPLAEILRRRRIQTSVRWIARPEW
ncbi:MAG TPA: 2-amino-4-hydroxy-6-hydroxymethyldihydropteridine diphosphokinase [Candidatus Eisenbacteria bacterium]|nr:2-amino-4-hydroxy-6-hydroxymethyldihydropteridine diphosphokinase [Candidatus Eisenbacteria bacterium]